MIAPCRDQMNTLSQTGDHDVHGTLEGFTGGRDNERGVINTGHWTLE